MTQKLWLYPGSRLPEAERRSEELEWRRDVASGGKRPGNLGELFDRADIVDVARRLGLQIDRRQTRPRHAVCPFHSDTTPSLNLYEGGSGDSPHYHCFACGAHGDLIGLVREVQKVTFSVAVRWLAEELGMPLLTAHATRVETRSATAALTSLIAQSRSDRFASFCEARGFLGEFLRIRSIGVVSLNGLIERARNDKIFAEALIELGITRLEDTTGPQDELWRGGLRGFFGGERVVFQIDRYRHTWQRAAADHHRARLGCPRWHALEPHA